ncbi:DUF916 domain-containing protein [Embleya sp. NBC_00888]|uniref:WxL protein peptidoglycan domain-containing protein n=1 Tax=Embleya sp. NBC_00888 TaxID=2975960 RepID=UPI0038697FE6|nr:DUF916 domain-containing protein [Embleya sp. NBC_00888]
MTGTSAPPSRRQGGRIRSLATLFAVLATLFASLTLVAPTPASAAGNGEWSVDPYVPDGTSQNARRYFFLEGAAGTTVPDVVTLHNTSQAPLTMKLFGADAYNTPRDGGFALRTVTDKQKDVGTWIQVAPENQTLTLQAGEKRQVPFNIVIPPNATPGDHPGAIVALNTAIEGTQQQGQIKVNIQRQIGARVYLRVQGDALPAMDVQKLEVERDAGFGQFFGSSDAKITYRIINRGNVILRPKFELRAEGLFGRKLMSKADEGIEILPGATVEKVVRWKDAPRLDHVTVKVNGAVADQNVTDSASTSYTAVPWPSLLTLALILLLAGGGWGVWRNRRKGNGGDPAKPGGPAGPTDDTTVLPPIPGEVGGAETAAESIDAAAPAEEPTTVEPAKAAAVAGTSSEVEASGTAAEPAAVATPAEAADADADADAEPVVIEKADRDEKTPIEGAASDGESARGDETADVEEKPADAEATVTAGDGQGVAGGEADPTEGAAAVNEAPAEKTSVADEPGSGRPATGEPIAHGPVPDEPAAADDIRDTAAEADSVEQSAAADTSAEAEPVTPEAAPAAEPAKKAVKRPKGKQPPARPRPDAPAAEDSADSAGVGR